MEETCLPFVDRGDYRRDQFKFDKVYDDCQVHRKAVVVEVGAMGLMECLKTYLVMEGELKKRGSWARKLKFEFIPRGIVAAGASEIEPVDLERRNKEAARQVKHPMMGCGLLVPRIVRCVCNKQGQTDVS